MHGQSESSGVLLDTLVQSLSGISCQVLVCPPALYIPLAHERLSGSAIELGIQNVHTEVQGAFTGEVSATMARDGL